MTTDRDDASVRRYREASTALDERPSAATRAAILAAAARHVDAKPSAAGAPRPTSRRRWPLAAAATVLLSTLAVMLATRTEHEMPTFTPPAERAQEQAAVAPAPVGPKANAEDSATPVGPSASPAIAAALKPETATADAIRGDHQAGGAPAARLKKSAPAAAPEGQRSVPSAAPEPKDEPPAIAADSAKSRVQAARTQEAPSAEARSAFPAAPAAAPPPPAVARPAPVQSPADALGAASAGGEPAKPDASTANREARKEAAPASAVQGAVRQEPARDFERSAHDWLERIIKLRGEGRLAEADAELKRFRERYPDVQVPAAALPPPAAGTR